MISGFVAEHGVGATVDPSNAEAIAAALRDVTEPGRNEALRDAVRRAREALDWRAESELLAAVYRDALGRSAR
jgi:hypothetical protein